MTRPRIQYVISFITFVQVLFYVQQYFSAFFDPFMALRQFEKTFEKKPFLFLCKQTSKCIRMTMYKLHIILVSTLCVIVICITISAIMFVCP